MGQSSCQDKLKPLGSTDELEVGGALQLGHSLTQHWQEEAGIVLQDLAGFLPCPPSPLPSSPFWKMLAPELGWTQSQLCIGLTWLGGDHPVLVSLAWEVGPVMSILCPC